MSSTDITRLSDFILARMEPIVQEWENFARTIKPSEVPMDREALRDHASRMLKAIAADLDTPQTAQEQAEKSKGSGSRGDEDTAAEAHAEERLLSGFSIEQLAAEYRALRASVLHLWAAESKKGLTTDPDDITRFNEGIDQALAESIARYAKLVDQAQHLFLAILGHDLRNPLGATINGANLIMRTNDIDSKNTAIATRIFNSGNRMNRLVDDLIDYTRTHLGSGLPITRKQTNITRICENVVGELRTSHSGRIIDLSAAGDLEGMWDEDRIAQVISNLLGNALQHGSKDDPVIMAVYPEADDIVVTINNQGSPIPPENLRCIFEPLVRFVENENTDSDTETSLGIGLYIVRQIVIAHGGTINVASSQEDGTTFTIRLPRVSSPENSPPLAV
jgi:signal transduction histidine kinase